MSCSAKHHGREKCRHRFTLSVALTPRRVYQEIHAGVLTGLLLPCRLTTFLAVLLPITICHPFNNRSVRTELRFTLLRKLSSAAVPTLDSAVTRHVAEQAGGELNKAVIQEAYTAPAARHCMSHSWTSSRRPAAATRKHYLDQDKRKWLTQSSILTMASLPTHSDRG